MFEEYSSRSEKAMAIFSTGRNCTQAVVLCFADLLDTDETALERLSSGFGGGIGRMRLTCGAVTGMFIVAGALYGFTASETAKEKGAFYQVIQDLAARFKDKCGSICCAELLEGVQVTDSAVPEERTPVYYKKRPCRELVGIAAEILAEYIEAKNSKKE